MIVLIGTLFCAVAGAGEKKVSEGEVPKPVLDGVARKYPAARKTGFEREVERGRTVYEVNLVQDGHAIDVALTPDGKIVSEEEEIAFDATPAAVQQALAASPKFGTWKVQRAERVVEAENTATPKYELLVTQGRKKAELVFSDGGKLLETEEK
jgi:hypothetical protein